MKRITRNELAHVLFAIETGFYNIDIPTQYKWTKRIHFFQKQDYVCEFLILKMEKDHVRVEGGALLKPEEKVKKWYFKDFDTTDELGFAIAKFTLKYANSFELVLTRK